MEPVTHLLTGACLARTGLNRRAAYATAAMTIAAEFPDIDTLWSLRGPVAGFEHHRGITHTFLGAPFEAGFLLLCFYLGHRFLRPRSAKAPAAPVNWPALYLLLVLALLSHIFLDYTNNYGVRPFFPFNSHWYAASIVFIFDPLLFLLLVGGLVLPLLFRLVGRELGDRRKTFIGRGWARAALAGVILLWSVRWVEHSHALQLAAQQTLRAPATLEDDSAASLAEPLVQGAVAPPDKRPLLIAQRSLASPDPISVFRWYTATDFGPADQLAVVDSRLGTLAPGEIFAKPAGDAILQAAEASSLGRFYLDWSPMPILTQTAGAPAAADLYGMEQKGAQTVTFTDPRFMGDTPLLRRKGAPPLTGQVILDPRGTVLDEGMDGRFAR